MKGAAPPLRVAVPVEQLMPLFPWSHLAYDEESGWSLALGGGQKLLAIQLEHTDNGTLTMKEDAWPHVVTPT